MYSINPHDHLEGLSETSQGSEPHKKFSQHLCAQGGSNLVE